ERWNLPEAEAVQRRRVEDEQACSMLGSSVRHQWLDYPDAIYRDPGYSSDDALFGTPLKCDMTLAEQVHEHLRNLGSSRFVIPLGVGNHVDHQIVCEAGQLLLRGGAD